MSVALLCLSLALGAEPQSYPRSELLIEPAALNERLAKTVVLDARSQRAYDEGHVPGAIHLDVPALSKAFSTHVDAEYWAHRLGDLGIDVNMPVVVYGDDWRESARVWWIIRYWGIKDVRLLNGPFSVWRDGRFEISKEPARSTRVAGKVAPSHRLASREEVLEMLKDKSSQLLDARSSDEYCGNAGGSRRKGSIPGAANIEWSQFIDAKTGKMKPASEISELLKNAGIDPAKPVVTYCQSGGRASVAAFVLELMGGDKVRNYYRSWADWGNAEDTPVARPEKK
jgi:thiosulfate/3-mercaptopyruvate sulfurtransferase